MVDYKKKYLKYKFKYLYLINGGGKNDRNDDLTNITSTFSTISNSGRYGNRFTNQCMWLSILEYINNVLGNNITLEDLRELASSNGTAINDDNDEFDYMDHGHALQNVIEAFDLNLHIYLPIRNDNNDLVIVNSDYLLLGDELSPNIISIIAYGAHFELITQINERRLYNNIIIANEFKPNLNLAVGKNSINLTANNKIEIEHLLEESINLKHYIMDLQKNITNNTNELIIINNNKHYNKDTNDELMKGINNSINTYKDQLTNQIISDKELLETIKLQNDEIKIALEMLLQK